MRKPRLIYDNDARHHLLYRYGPPLTDYLLGQPVDEILGTSVDTLFYGSYPNKHHHIKVKQDFTGIGVLERESRLCGGELGKI